jgi:hypothetical protein
MRLEFYNNELNIALPPSAFSLFVDKSKDTMTLEAINDSAMRVAPSSPIELSPNLKWQNY